MAESLNRRGNAKHWTVFPFEGIIKKVYTEERTEWFNAGGLGIADG